MGCKQKNQKQGEKRTREKKNNNKKTKTKKKQDSSYMHIIYSINKVRALFKIHCELTYLEKKKNKEKQVLNCQKK